MLRAFWSCLCAALAVPTVLAGVHEKVLAVPQGWTPGAPIPEDSVNTFTVVLQLAANVTSLEAALLAVSTPGSPDYGHYWSKKQVDDAFGPDGQVVSKVVSWLETNGIQEVQVDGPFIDFSADVATVNRLLGASYQHYHADGITKLRTLEYSIPDDLQSHIALVDPGTYFGKTTGFSKLPNHMARAGARVQNLNRRDATKTSPAASCQTSITPACLRDMYDVGDYKPDSKSGSWIGFGSFLNQSAVYTDLAQFLTHNNITFQNFTTQTIANGTNGQDPRVVGIDEANLDVQTIIGIANPLPVVQFSTGGSPPFIPTLGQPTAADNMNEPYVPYYRYLLAKENADLPQVISNSYGDQEDGVPFNYANLTCNLIGLLGLRGITTLFSSGDSGVGDGCLAPDFKTVEFIPSFPATCPYVTAVGGTSDVAPEVAWNLSSGGFSKYFPRPAYQDATVQTYLDTQVSKDTYAYYANFTNWKGRAFPDVAAHSLTPDFEIVYAGRLSPSGGTSAAAPVWAAVVGLLNDARLRAGKPALGWLNPLLYGVGKDALIDITGGYTYGCLPPARNTTVGVVPGARWNATKGWDPTTGFGTPDFQKLKDLVLKL